jgi:predicted deacylase
MLEEALSDTDGVRSIDLDVGLAVPLPVTVGRRGRGPRVLVLGGTHGDEAEGQIAVAELARDLPHLPFSGTIICLPRHNPMACAAGTRTDPQTAADLCRQYHEGPLAGPLAPIVRLVRDRLMPGCDWLIDLHSGGTSGSFVSSGNVQAKVGSDEDLAMRPALHAFGAPFGILFDEIEDGSMAHTGTPEALARKRGIRAFSSELGGGGVVGSASMRAARDGLRSLLGHIGSLPAATGPSRRTTLLRLDRPEHSVLAPAAGLVEPMVPLGATVTRGDTILRFHPRDPGEAAYPVAARVSGVLAMLTARAHAEPGDTLAFVCEPVTDATEPPLQNLHLETSS